MIQLTNEQLKKLQGIQLDMLVEIKRICEKHDIKYSLIGGTLLGAIRHKGYIPWDDDADVGMLREDYERFRKIAEEELDSEKYYFQDDRNTEGDNHIFFEGNRYFMCSGYFKYGYIILCVIYI